MYCQTVEPIDHSEISLNLKDYHLWSIYCSKFIVVYFVRNCFLRHKLWKLCEVACLFLPSKFKAIVLYGWLWLWLLLYACSFNEQNKTMISAWWNFCLFHSTFGSDWCNLNTVITIKLQTLTKSHFLNSTCTSMNNLWIPKGHLFSLKYNLPRAVATFELLSRIVGECSSTF
jgi:hypothetical protein